MKLTTENPTASTKSSTYGPQAHFADVLQYSCHASPLVLSDKMELYVPVLRGAPVDTGTSAALAASGIG